MGGDFNPNPGPRAMPAPPLTVAGNHQRGLGRKTEPVDSKILAPTPWDPSPRSARLLFVVGPHPDDLYRPFFRVDLIDEAMLDVDPTRPGSGEIADQFLAGRWGLEWILLQNLKQAFGVGPKVVRRQLPGVLLGLPGVVKLPTHQLSSVLDLLSGSRNPFRMDSRIPGIERR